MEKDQYYYDLMNEISGIADSGGHGKDTVFTELAAELISDAGSIDTISLTSFCDESRGLKVDGFALDEEQGLLSLYITEFYDNSSIKHLTRNDIALCFKRVIKFFINCFNKKYLMSLADSSKARNLAEEIVKKSDRFDKVKFVVLTNADLSKRVGELTGGIVHGRKSIYDIWHLGRFFRLDQAGRQREEIIIDFSQFGNKVPLHCLPVVNGSSVYRSYLLAIPGILLAQLYDQYGERLLEQNVRTFLQFGGKINRGIRNTLKTEPGMFFAYNNGITATADEVVIVEQENVILLQKVINLQIVNGGQTTASLAHAFRKDKIDLSEVSIPLKLSVIQTDKEDDVIPKISECANTQNKINSDDFLSNHPFHRRLEELSRQILAPPMEGRPIETHWFYERVRGQFATRQFLMTPLDKKQFQIINPKNQMFNKIDLAKFVHSWDQLPYLVSLGGQKNFAIFSTNLATSWSENSENFNICYFKDLIVKAIIFRTLDRLIMKQTWYGGYKANIVTYSISKMLNMINKNNMLCNFDMIWREQQLSKMLIQFLLNISEKVNMVIQQTPEGITNVTEWCKKKECWENVVNAFEIEHMEIPELYHA